MSEANRPLAADRVCEPAWIVREQYGRSGIDDGSR
jgi:hypothetical protein